MKTRIASILLVSLLSLASVQSQSHDVTSLGSGHWVGARAAFPPSALRSIQRSAPGSSKSLFSIWEVAKLWTAGSTVDVCFFGGSPALRQKISASANEWTHYGNIRLDFGPNASRSCDINQPSSIRVGFSEPGYWSYVGTESLDTRIIKLSSVNLEAFDTNLPDDATVKRLVLHEFGHALGFDHEHQAPSAGCDSEIDWAYADQWLGKQGWSPQMVKDNLGALDVSSGAYAGPALTSVDRKSIMHYSLPPQLFLKGQQSKCWIPNNADLSDIDKKGMASAYPTNPVELQALLTVHRAVLDAAVSLKTLPPEVQIAVRARQSSTSAALHSLRVQ